MLFLSTVRSLHFYLDADEKRCFVEELPTDTVVEGMLVPLSSIRNLTRGTGHYKALEWDETNSLYEYNEKLGVQVDVEVCICSLVYSSILNILGQEMDTQHTVVKVRGPNEGRFTFTSHDSGDHSICLSTNYTPGWFTSRHIKMYLDVTVGASKRDVEHDRSHIGEVASKIRELNERLRDIRREQQYQREREAAYRDLSEATNARAIWYCIAQIIVLVATCAWQLRHLKVSALCLYLEFN